MSKVLVAGGGAAGMLAAIAAAEKGHQVILFEKNEKLGKKLYITGKGRCNITNNCDVEELLSHVVSNRRFLYSAFYGFTSQDMMALLEKAGLRLKTERGNRVFPQSDKSSDVIKALTGELKRLHVAVHLETRVTALQVKDGGVCGVEYTPVQGKFAGKKQIESGDRVILATGGLSYPSTGSTGDGFRLAKRAGHQIVECRPALVPFETKEQDIRALQGLSLKNVELSLRAGGKVLYQEMGEMLFTHFGISGPLVLSASSYGAAKLEQGLTVSIDLKPALSPGQLDERILRDFSERKNNNLKNGMGKLLPAGMIPVIIGRSGISPDKKVHEITREERRNLLELIKNFTLHVTAARGFSEAIITQGGVSVKEIEPSTMESKHIKGLHFAGEMLDLDALTGGFNLQIAWSTGFAAGSAV